VRFLLRCLGLLMVLALLGAGGAAVVLHHFSQDLPDYGQLAEYEPPIVTRIHAGDGRLLAEYAEQKRVFVPVDAVPERVKQAFISAEDQEFYEHPGVDFKALLRAVITNVRNLGSNRRPVGASTITQQVAKNFLLTNEVSIERKIKEAILAFRIEQAYSKDKILELYLNEIFLGQRSYGVAAAALNYFNKSLDELSIEEAAYLAALPKAPNNYHPTRRTEAAVSRRNWVIGRMLEDGHIGYAEAEMASAEPLATAVRAETEIVNADFFAEEVRRDLERIYGEDELYGGGLSVQTTIDPTLQRHADAALREGLVAYDRRHGWRGPVAQLDPAVVDADWAVALKDVPPPAASGAWQRALVLALSANAATIGLVDGTQGRIPMAQLAWARPTLEEQKVGARPNRPSDVLAVGDVVLVEPVSQDSEGKDYEAGTYGLRQIPAVNGGLIALDPHTGRILAMSGGYSYAASVFNRAIQARRQPGSAFKPFVYLAALDNGYTPSSIVLDAPIVFDQGPGQEKWKPANYTSKFYGPTTLRIGLEKSRNLMTVRLAQAIGMEKVADYGQRFGIYDNLPTVLSMSLGAGETTLLRVTTAYAMLVNGGKRVTPSLIDRVQNANGETIYRHDTRECPNCRAERWEGQMMPRLPDIREQVADPVSAYQIVAMLQGAVQQGTGVRLASLGRPLAGKTGTTNDYRDAWFVGFSPDLAIGVYVGFDDPKTLGKGEAGSRAALPIWKAFAEKVFENKPRTPFRVPPGVRLVKVAHASGQLPRPGEERIILEAFREGSEPRSTGNRQLLQPVVRQPGVQGSEGAAGATGATAPLVVEPAPVPGQSGIY